MPHHCRAALPVTVPRRGTSSLGSDAAPVGARDRTSWYQLGFSAAAHFLPYLSSRPIFAPHAFPCSLLLPSHLVERKIYLFMHLNILELFLFMATSLIDLIF